MFPTPKYIQECIKNADRLREEWEPRVGDWYYSLLEEMPHLLTTTVYFDRVPQIMRHFVPLFQPRQIIEMLLQRGLRVVIHTIPTGETKVRAYWPRYVGEGPDSACALLRAWLEVVKEE